MPDWSRSTIATMKDVLRDRGAPVSGNHAELVERLEELDAGERSYALPPKGIPEEDLIDEAADGMYVAMNVRPSASIEEALDRFIFMLHPVLEDFKKYLEERQPEYPITDKHSLMDKPAATKSRVGTHDARNFSSAIDLDEENGEDDSSDLVATRDEVRNAARKLLTLQPDGRDRALSILSEFGGSVSAVPESDLGKCLEGLEQERWRSQRSSTAKEEE